MKSLHVSTMRKTLLVVQEQSCSLEKFQVTLCAYLFEQLLIVCKIQTKSKSKFKIAAIVKSNY